jgi:hypothetical protein
VQAPQRPPDLLPKGEALKFPLELDEGRYRDFQYYLRALDLDGLQRLGTELRDEHLRTVEEGDLGKAGDLLQQEGARRPSDRGASLVRFHTLSGSE